MLQLLLFLATLFECSLCNAHYIGSTPLIIHYQVWEEQPPGTRVGCLMDDLRQRGEMGSLENFQFIQRGHNLPVTVAARDGTVSTLGRLDREELCWGAQICELAFNVLYRKSGAMHFFSVRLEIMDLNDHSPVFPSPVQEVEISETAALRMRIPLDCALDPDAGLNGLQTYSLSSNQHFALDVHTSGRTKQAELIIMMELDREMQPSLELILTAFDKGNPPKSGSTTVLVTILDSNDNSPVFEDAPTFIELAEDTVRGTIILNLNATDPDQGANGEVEYSLSKHVPLDVQRLFSIHPKTGILTLLGPLDFEEKNLYELDIQSRDLGPNAIPSHHKLQIKLQDVNDNAPRIHITWTTPDSPIATVLEGAPNETFVALVMVSDADSGSNGQVRVCIIKGPSPFRLKQIYGDNYMVVTNDTLDRERQMEYNLTLLAQDSGNPSLSCIRHLNVHVLDENDNAPLFTQSHYRSVLKENNIPGFHFLNVEANDVDLDLSGKVSFHIRETNELGTSTALFSVHPTSGAVTAQQSLDFEESNSYSFIVEAVDRGYPPMTSTSTVLVDIQDVNDNYPIIHNPLPKKGVAVLSVPVNVDNAEIVTNLGNKALHEHHKSKNVSSHSKPEGLLATTIRASDLDSGLNGRLLFQITDGNPSNTFFLDKSTGHLYVNTTNATELIGRTFKLGIVVSDMGTPVLKTKAALEITFINYRDHLKNMSHDNHAQYSFTMLLALCLGSTCLLLLLTLFLAKTLCHPHKQDNQAYNCRQAESTYTRHPRRPQRQIHKSDIHLVPVLRGRKENQPEDEAGALTSTVALKMENPHSQGQFNHTPTLACTAQNQAQPEMDKNLPVSPSKILRKPRDMEWNRMFPEMTYQTLHKTRNSSSSSFSNSQTPPRHHRNKQVNRTTIDPSQIMNSESSNQATLRRPKTTERQERMAESDHSMILRNLVRLSMAAFAEKSFLELSSASPDVQQVSELLSLLHQGQLQPRPNFRGNKYSHRTGRSGPQDTDWLSTKDSGHGESEIGDIDWEACTESPVDDFYEEGLHNLINSDDVFSDVPDPEWMARLSLPLMTDYHENLFIPDRPVSPEGCCPMVIQDDSTSFSTFGKSPEKTPVLVGKTLMSEVSSLFEMILTKKADAQSCPPADVLYRLSEVYRRSLGLAAPANGGGASIHHQGSTSIMQCSNPIP